MARCIAMAPSRPLIRASLASEAGNSAEHQPPFRPDAPIPGDLPLAHHDPDRRVAPGQVIRGPQAGEAGPDDRHVGVEISGQRIARRRAFPARCRARTTVTGTDQIGPCGTSWQVAGTALAIGHAGAMATSSSAANALPEPRDPRRPYRICVVCLGNICRSPMAEVILRDELAAAGLGGKVDVDSAGTGDWHLGEAMDRRARAELSRRGYDGSRHEARQIQPSWLDRLRPAACHGPQQPGQPAAHGERRPRIWPAGSG